MSAIQDYHARAPRISHSPWCVPPVRCADGFSMSVQASVSHYCSPKEFRDDGQYDSWEIADPSARERLLLKRYTSAKRRWNPLEAVYGWVPTRVVDQIIAKHGGLAEEIKKQEGASS